ncbi:PLP-dependent aminotransferase family protein [Actinomadura verrucosospora]|uniref:GntR family transcriptional regulator n=1 Tax=Actinomadura verrucosospora TaxID=46165 RepID=A0A7D4AJ02_ACTVE|nr:PLP-dependent aminotransferase family protein [Actinomadura verrucosospora]QKG19888.1 GntR family transcriptional regulator [Actinomadura verrucosospora]
MTALVRPAARAGGVRPSPLAEAISAGLRPGVVPLTVGSPAPELQPTEALGEALARVHRDVGAAALGYGPPEGHPELRAMIAERSAERGTPCRADDVIVTNGSQQALDLVGRMLLEPGSAVVVERPTYLGAIEAFRQYETEFVPVGMDEDGMRTDELERVLAADAGRRIRLIYTMPNYHNPTGRTLSAERRVRLVELAQRYAVPVVEDDAYAELGFDPVHRPTLAGLDDSGLVLALGSMSKVLSPGLRVGWAVARGPFHRILSGLKERSDLLSALAPQLAVVDLCRDGGLDAHLARVVPRYRERRDAMAAAVDRHLGAAVARTEPAGGFYLWLSFRSGLDTRELFARAVRGGVAFLPGGPFHVDGTGAGTLRLGYAGAGPELIDEGVRRLAAAAGEHRLAAAG